MLSLSLAGLVALALCELGFRPATLSQLQRAIEATLPPLPHTGVIFTHLLAVSTGHGAWFPRQDFPLPCDEGLTNCYNYYCADLLTDYLNCGACDNWCFYTKICQNGQCVCPPEYPNDCGLCVDVQTDTQNCGACGVIVSTWNWG